MNKTYGSCGLICSECPAYLAFKNDDEELRKKTAQEWSKLYAAEISPKNINCTGCRMPGIKFGHCNECEIRLCAIRNNVNTCADCPEYICSALKGFIQYVPEAKNTLEELREKLNRGDNA